MPGNHSNKIQQSIKKNKQRDLIRKHLSNNNDHPLYPVSRECLDVLAEQIADRRSCWSRPVGLLSSLLFDLDHQAYFYQRLLTMVQKAPGLSSCAHWPAWRS